MSTESFTKDDPVLAQINTPAVLKQELANAALEIMELRVKLAIALASATDLERQIRELRPEPEPSETDDGSTD